MNFFSGGWGFFFAGRELKFVQIFEVFVQKIKKCPDVFSERKFGVSENVGTSL